MLRIRFETKTIAPVKLPSFVYAASVLTHSSVQYTVLIEQTLDEKQVSTQQAILIDIHTHWPDAVIISAEVGVDSFQAQDLSLNGYVYGTYDSAPPPEIGFLSKSWAFLFGKRGRTVTSVRHVVAPYSPLTNLSR